MTLMKYDINTRLELNNGTSIPILGFGVWRSKSGEQTRQAVTWALKHGYRHIDTAAFYANEQDVGDALRQSGLRREEVFITTKLWNTDMRQHRQFEAFQTSLRKLGMDYVDLYLIHWPVENFMESWRCLERIYESGAARAIGVSNFKKHHLQTLLAECNVAPAVDQMEFSPYMQDREALEFCRERGIVYEAWSPLGAGAYTDDPIIKAVGSKYGKSPAQTILRWVIQQDIVVFPKSVHESRIAENADIFDFELSEEDMAEISSLNEFRRTGSDPDTFTF